MIGQLVEVSFMDHCIEGPGEKNDELMVFKVWGRVQSVTKTVLTIRTWELQSGDYHTKKKNNEVAKILVSAIKDLRFLQVLPETRLI